MGSCNRKHNFISLWLILLFIIYSVSSHSCAAQIITKGQSITDGETIKSGGDKFVLGFFSPENSSDRYAGIWYNELPVQSVVWVANRETPISGGGAISIGADGNLMVSDRNGARVWSSNVLIPSGNSSVVLSASGDLMLYSINNGRQSNKPSWNSFSFPTDTFLPGMRVYVDVAAGEKQIFSSWKSPDDPSPGNYSMGVDPNGSPQIVIWDGNNRRWRSGYWTGQIFTGVPTMRAAYLYGFRFSPDNDGRYYFSYTPSNSSDIIKFRLTWDGLEEQQRWNGELDVWNVSQLQPATECDLHNRCGAFGKCSSLSTPICSCMEGFEPKNSDEWYNRGDYSGGCIRKVQLQCERNSSVVGEEGSEEKDGFLKVEGVKLPDFVGYVVGEGDTEGCEERCMGNCSCVAYAFVVGINCMIWSGDLIDVQHFAEGGDTLYIRVAHAELGGNDNVTKVIIIVVVVVGLISLSVLAWVIWRRRSKLKAVQDFTRRSNELRKAKSLSGAWSTDFSGPDDLSVEGQQGAGPELPLFNFSVVVAATNNFSHENKLGQGGFGLVYKGVLPGNQKIAVKRLSRKSGQGLEEFKNEITLIAKLQHRNLVRLMGCCIQEEEKMLIYEYMPNRSLDSFLFDTAKQAQLDWGTRFNIIEGIARGLLYLHRDSRLRIIHRDLKASNILLDEEMNPKISDFGMARIFGGNQNEANTNRVVGTYGYMAPEYAMEGLFSVKSDVYSFGILLLEIISGHKNTSYRSSEYSNIKGYAWDLWDKGEAMELIDPSIASSCNQDEVRRCIHIAMLCVQDSANHRPNMAAVVLMLESENAVLPLPRQPVITSMRRSVEEDDMWHVSRDASSNNVTITTIVGR